MRILGIDPGLCHCGLWRAGLCARRVLPCAVRRYHHAGAHAFEQRLEEIYFDMTQLLQNLKPDAVAMEQLYFQHNQTTAMAVAQARGVLLLCAQLARVPVFEYTPMQVKQSVTGYGKATKKQVQEMTRTLLRMQPCQNPMTQPTRWRWPFAMATAHIRASMALPARAASSLGTIKRAGPGAAAGKYSKKIKRRQA